MVSLPIAALVTVTVTHASQVPTQHEWLTSTLGQSEALVRQVAGPDDVILQSPTDAELQWRTDDPDRVTSDPPSGALDSRLPGAADAIGLTEVTAAVVTAEANLIMSATVGDAWDPILLGRYELADGATPTAADQIMISPSALDRLGLSVGAELTVAGEDVTLVGVLRQGNSSTQQIFVPAGWIGTAAGDQPTDWFIRDEPLSWQDVSRLNEHGIVTYSRDVVEHPPADDPLAEDYRSSSLGIGPIIAIALGGGIVVVLLAGSAFTVGLRREQRMLGMFAVSGADRRHVAAISIATGGWLGLIGGVAGTGMGLAFAWGVQSLARGLADPASNTLDATSFWGFHVPWWEVLAAVAFAVVIGAAASAIPATMASRRDVISSLRGASRPSAASRRLSLVGALSIAVGIAGLVWGRRALVARLSTPESWNSGVGFESPAVIALSALLAFAGVILVVPMLLAGLARVTSRAGIAPRLAARDAYRQSLRTTSVIIAIAISSMAVTAAASIVTQSAAAEAANYVGNSPVGTLRVDLLNWNSDGWTVADSAASEEAIRSVDPEATVTRLNVIPDAGFDHYQEQPSPAGVSVVFPAQNRCPIYTSNGDPDSAEAASQMSQADVSADVRCRQWATYAEESGEIGRIVVGGQAELEALLGATPTPQALQTLDAGGAVLLTPAYLDGSSVTLGLWNQVQGNWNDSSDAVPESTLTLDAVLNEPEVSPIRPFAVVVSPDTATRLGVDPSPSVLIASSPGGFTQTQADAVNAQLRRQGDLYAMHSPGPQPDLNRQFMWILVAGLVALAFTAAAVSIGLARADAGHDDATLVSVGASPAVTRHIAMWQAIWTVGLAVFVGTGLGLALAWAISAAQPGAPFAVPWQVVGVVALGLPVVIAAGAFAFTRPARSYAYRLAA